MKSIAKNQMRNELVLITGGTDGIGLELVKLYLSKGFQVLSTGRRKTSELPENFPAAAIYVQADQNDISNVDAILSAIAAISPAHLHIAILNAATGVTTRQIYEDEADIKATLKTNLDFNIVLAHGLFSYFVKSHESLGKIGKLVFIGSVAYKGAANFPSYAATKAGLHGLARALREEWRDFVNVQIIHPGPTRTSMHKKARLDVSKVQWMFASAQNMAWQIADAVERGNLQSSLGILSRLKTSARWRLSSMPSRRVG